MASRYGLRELGLKSSADRPHGDGHCDVYARLFARARLGRPFREQAGQTMVQSRGTGPLGRRSQSSFLFASGIGLVSHHKFGTRRRLSVRKRLCAKRTREGPSDDLSGSCGIVRTWPDCTRLFEDEPSAPPPDLPYGQMRVCFLRIMRGDKQVGWASGATYSPNLRRMISLGRIDRELSETGTEVVVIWGNFADEPTMDIRARVHDIPFIRQRRRDDLTATQGA